jgi:hypothetical protein
MPDEEILRDQARAVVQSGKLPARAPDRTWGGPGVGAGCAVCGVPVTRDEMEFEIQFARDGDNPGLDKFHVHIRCFAAWEFERKRALETPSRPTRIKTTRYPEEAGAVRCEICGKGISNAADIVTKGGNVMHLSCYEGKSPRP